MQTQDRFINVVKKYFRKCSQPFYTPTHSLYLSFSFTPFSLSLSFSFTPFSLSLSLSFFPSLSHSLLFLSLSFSFTPFFSLYFFLSFSFSFTPFSSLNLLITKFCRAKGDKQKDNRKVAADILSPPFHSKSFKFRLIRDYSQHLP